MPVFSLPTKPFLVLSAISFALLLWAAALPAQPLEPLATMAESLKGNVVAIRTAFDDGHEEQGFGFITGEQGGRLFIATAAHVVVHRETKRRASGIEVKFSNDISWVRATYKAQWEAEDLALLELGKPDWAKWKTNFADFSPKLFQPVRFLGRYGGGEPRWVYPGPNGEVFEMSGHTLSFSITTLQPGCSGAPLFGDKGIVGLVVSDDQSDSRALHISRIRELFSNNGQYPYFSANQTPPDAPDNTKEDSNVNTQLPASLQKLEADMLRVAGGSFTMGCKDATRDGSCDDDEKPPREVQVPAFSIGKYEVTQAQWRAVMGSDPPELYNKGCDQCPVERVSWNDIQDFLKKLNTLTGKRYRLPTEAEWEYAARGGAQSRGFLYSGSNTIDEVAWYDDNSGGNTRPVGGKKPNELGLYDMSGNVWEWCEDDWHDSYNGAPTDGSAWVNKPRGSRRVLRGGSWFDGSAYCRAALRIRYDTSSRYSNVGFRLARD